MPERTQPPGTKGSRTSQSTAKESPWDVAIDAIKRKGSLTRSGLSRRTKGKQKIARNGRKGGIRRGGIGGEEGGVRMGFRDREAFRGFLGDRFPVLGRKPLRPRGRTIMTRRKPFK
ncbi:hypothetical protein B296_00038855, partial [Ensete ventricosum]